MLFAWKNPLKKKLTSEELHRSREEFETRHTDSGNFVGASLIDKAAWVFPSVHREGPLLFAVSGTADTCATITPSLLCRQAIEQRKSVLFIDFADRDLVKESEPIWHRLWALSFYLDRARAFRLFDCAQKERSDALGEHLPAEFAELLPHLAQKDHAVDPAVHLQQEKGILAFAGANAKEVDCLWQIAGRYLAYADLTLVHHLNALDAEKPKALLNAWLPLAKEGKRNLALVMHGTSAHSLVAEVCATEPALFAAQIMFRQENALPEACFSRLKSLAAAGPLARVMHDLDPQLSALQPSQALLFGRKPLAEANAILDLIQVNDAEGLPWPPEYRPLRARHPGT